MNELLIKIKSKGYWRIHFEPAKYESNLIPTPADCKTLVERNWVNFQGWDFPHYPTQETDYQKIGVGDGFCESFTDFQFYKEFWRLYTSGQFISYKAIYEDWYSDITNVDRREKYVSALPGQCIGVYFNIFSVCCQVFEFLSKIARQNIYESVQVKIELYNMINRQLWGQRKSWETERGIYITSSNVIIAFDELVSQSELINDPMKLARKCILKIVNSFGWNPHEIQIVQFQEQIRRGV